MPLIRVTIVKSPPIRLSDWGMVDNGPDGNLVVTAVSRPRSEMVVGETPGQLLDRLCERYGRVSVAVTDQPEFV